MKLGLGTVQFGVDYGVSNSGGQTPAGEVAEILAVAQRNNIRVVDTAALYGTSEAVLGVALPAGHQFRLVTKTARFDGGRMTCDAVRLLEQTFLASLAKLRCPSVYGLLIHNADDLLQENGQLLMEKMGELKQRGLVQKIGVSIYTAEHIDRVLERFAIDLVQIPINVLDQRLLLGGQLARLKKAGIEIHARSVFLQGLLLMEPERLPPYFDPIRPCLAAYRQMLRTNGLTPVNAALGFVSGLDEIDYAICGINNRQQLEEICSGLEPLSPGIFQEFALSCEEMVNPALWRL